MAAKMLSDEELAALAYAYVDGPAESPLRELLDRRADWRAMRAALAQITQIDVGRDARLAVVRQAVDALANLKCKE